MVSLTVRGAGEDDWVRLLAWRNDPATRAASYATEEIDPQTHRAWLARTLADPGTALFIAEADGEPVGQVRLVLEEAGMAEVHIGLAPEARGRRLAAPVLELAVAQAGSALGARTVRARVKPANEASLRAFRAAGFAETAREGDVVEFRREV